MGIRKILAKVGSYFAKKPKPLPGSHAQGSGFRYGHRGTAMGSVAKPDLSKENVAQWRTFGENEARNFMEGVPIHVHSSNVAVAQYFPDANKLLLEFKNGASYMYDDIDENMAWDFLHAVSKGSWTWDKLRIRGTKYGHKKPYRKVR